MRKIILITLMACLAGCATNREQDWYWYKPRATQDDFYNDNGQCKAQAFSVANGNLFQIVMVLESCMQGKGWRKVAK